jgi:hypothetical protein
MVINEQEINRMEELLLSSPNSSIRILKSPYGDHPIVISSDVTGEISAPTLSEALSLFFDTVLFTASEVSVEEELDKEG